jgi:putative endonuclease
MTLLRQFKGKKAEVEAVRLLKESGMKIVTRNYRCRLGEIDIVVEDGDVLVFVEVRSRSGTGYGLPQESIGAKKIFKIRKVAQHYIMVNGVHKGGYRFDVVAVMLNNEGDINNIEHIRNAF